MAKHITKVPEAVRSLVAWQEANALMWAARKVATPRVLDRVHHEIQQLSEKILNVLEQGHTTDHRPDMLASLWESLALLKSMEQKARAATLDLDAPIERARAAMESLLKVYGVESASG